MSNVTVSQTDRELIFDRIYEAPRELVWKAFTEADRIRKWWGPKACPVSYCTLDFRIGGVWLYSLKCSEEAEHWAKSVYQEIEALQRIVYVTSFVKGRTGELLEGVPSAGMTTILFTVEAGNTRITARIECKTVEDLTALTNMGMIPGYTETLSNLEEYLNELSGTGE
jgi:uncharacterized protein YndB with AHSA1/START domain